MDSVPASSLHTLARQWSGHLAHYRRHRNDERLEALVEEAIRFTGFHLEDDLASSPYWAEAPLARRVAVLLFLVDRGAIRRVVHDGQVHFEVDDGAESWVLSQPALAPYLAPTLELISAVRGAAARRPERG